MLVEKTNPTTSPTDTLCEECSLKISFRHGTDMASIVSNCQQCAFSVQFEDEEHVYEQKMVDSFVLASSYLSKGSCILMKHGQYFSILVSADQSTSIATLQEKLGNLAEYAVIVSSDKDAYKELTPFVKGSHFLGSEQFQEAKDICEWRLETPQGLLHVSPPRNIMELLTHTVHESDLFVITSKATDIHEWDLKMKYKHCVDYYLMS